MARWATRLPIVVKGIIRCDDALRAVDHGAQAIVVSNHSGRQLDTAPPTALVLPKIVTPSVRVQSSSMEGFGADGRSQGTGVRSKSGDGWSSDSLRLAVNGEDGVVAVYECLKDELLEVALAALMLKASRENSSANRCFDDLLLAVHLNCQIMGL